MPRLSMPWKRNNNGNGDTRWTCGAYMIELSLLEGARERPYLLARRGCTIDAFATLEDAKAHARGMAYLEMEHVASG